MARLFYDLFLLFLRAGFRLAAWANPKARKWVLGRKGLLQTIERQFGTETSPVAWFHCASLGEFEQARPVLDAFRHQYPDWKIVLTFFSPSGYEARRTYPGADAVYYLPVDTARNARRFVGAIRPQLVFWVKYEFWYHYLRVLREHRVPTVLFSAIFRPNQVFFQFYGGLYRDMLRCFSQIFVQTEESVHLLQTIGIQIVAVGGDTRCDRVLEIDALATHFPLIEAFKGGGQLMVVGSSWPDDQRVITAFSQTLAGTDVKLVIAPHEINSTQIARWQAEMPLPSLRYSQATPDTVREAQVLWIDNVGMLSGLYRYAEYAFIGGAYGDGLHNTLEAAVYGMPIFFGDKVYQKFAEAHDLLALGCAFAVADAAELNRVFLQFRTHEASRRHVAEQAAAYVRRNAGATDRVLAWTAGVLKN